MLGYDNIHISWTKDMTVKRNIIETQNRFHRDTGLDYRCYFNKSSCADRSIEQLGC